MVRSWLTVAATFVGACLHAGIAHSAQTSLTGCLTSSGILVNIAIGTKPLKKCTSLQKQVTFGGSGNSGTTQVLPFFALLDGDGTTKQIATIGPFTLAAKCNVVPQGNGICQGAGACRVSEIDITANVDGWEVANIGPQPANASAIFDMSPRFGINGAGYLSSQGSAATAPDGTFLHVAEEALGTGLFGHDCLAAGTIEYFKANLGASAPAVMKWAHQAVAKRPKT